MSSLAKITLGDFIDVITDYHANGAYEKLKENVCLKYEPDFAIMIRTLNFESNDFKSNLIYLNEKEYNYLSKTKVYPYDLAMNKIANPGSVYLMPDLNKPVSLAMNLFLIRFNKKVDQKF
jgi:type I restriction enzyme S subunit